MASKDTHGHRDRLRERFLAGEDGSRTDERLLELLLTYAIPRRDVSPLACELIEQHGSLDAVLRLDYDALIRIPGIGPHAAGLIRLVDWLRRDYRTPQADGSVECEWESGLQLPLDLDAGATAAEASHAREDVAMTQPKPPAEGEGEGHSSGVSPGMPEVEQTEGPPPGGVLRTRVGTGLFSKAVLREGIELAPRLPDEASMPELREFLTASLHYSSVQTRERHAGYILRRLFPNGEVDHGFLRFARHHAGRQELRDVCFYRFCRAESLMVEVMDQLVIPALAGGRLLRERIASYLSNRFPSNRVVHCSQAIAQALGAANLARVTPTTITFAYRDVLIPSFAFVVHSEFPEPGMYDLSLLQENPRIRAMLWDPGRIVTAVYELRNRGLISKVSEIDNIRQFTTTLTLEQVVERLVSDGGGHEVG